jgi:hypothetical protein
MVATRIALDFRHPCLACGAAWRVRSRAEVPARTTGLPAVWEPDHGECSDRCWEMDPLTYDRCLDARMVCGWADR